MTDTVNYKVRDAIGNGKTKILVNSLNSNWKEENAKENCGS